MIPANDLSDDDAVLLAGLRAGEDAAFERLVRKNTPRLMAVARRILGSDEDAKDAVQDAFIAVLRSIDDFAGAAKLSTWLHRIAVNASLTKLRSRHRKAEGSLETLLPRYRDDGHHVEQFSRWAESIDAAIERSDIQAAVRACIAQLPESYRTVLVLRDIEDIDTDDTAAALGLTPNAVKIRLHRARQALRTLLAPHMGGAPS